MSPLFKGLVSHTLMAVVGGGVGGIAVWSVASHGGAPKISRELSAARSEGDASAGSRASANVVSDGRSGRRLEERLATLERQTRSQTAIAQYVQHMDPDAGANDPTLQGLVAANNPVLETAVRGVMDRIATERKEQRETDAKNRQMERATNASNLLEDKLKLDGNQKAQVEQAFLTAMDSLRKLRESGQEGTPGPGAERIDWRQATTNVRQTLDKEISSTLSEAQRKTYAELKQKDEDVRELSRMFGGGRGGGRADRGREGSPEGGPP